MREFNYSKIKDQKWDSEILGLVAAIYKEAGKQELYLKQRPEKLERLVGIAKVQRLLTRLKGSLQPIRAFGNWSKKKRRQRIVMSRKSSGTAMFSI